MQEEENLYLHFVEDAPGEHMDSVRKGQSLYLHCFYNWCKV